MAANPESYLPLRPVEYLLLLSLVDEERHGYGLVRAIAERSNGLVELEPGNLYRVIKRLLDDNLIVESARKAAPESNDERRRYYRLTALGQRVAAAETYRLRALTGSIAALTVAPRARA